MYKDSPFTRIIEDRLASDVTEYYLFILSIFVTVNLCAFMVLWSFLRQRVTYPILEMNDRLKTNDKR